ncbi:hypothetical protein BDZ45DRAFT_742276 [Acephala macrosclerotiorum]|nr:hypothetical protein BDZ45DRAFT_742276 [Acephala macrosclerotiorum]
MHYIITFSILGLTRLSYAICPGFNYGFFNLQYQNKWCDASTPYTGCYKWAIANGSCVAPINGCPNDNPCSECDIYDQTSGFGCSAGPDNVHVDKIQVYGLWHDPNAGECDMIHYSDTGEDRKYQPSAKVESCCRNDGKRNLELGLISEREYQAIEATNAMLDIHKREYADALTWMSSSNITALRDSQIRELKEAEEYQLRARDLDHLS